MANAVVTLRAIAWTALQETMRRKVFYLVVFLLLLLLAIMGAQAVTVQMATEAGETTIVSQAHSAFVKEIFGIWGYAVMLLSLYLGAVAVSSEVAARTIVNVLSRPVKRSTYLAGRWLGILSFLWGFQLIGVVLALVATRAFDVPYTSMLWLGCVEAFVSALFYSGVSLSLSVGMPPVLAGGLAFFLPLLPSIAGDALKHPHWYVRVAANLAYFLGPASMPVDLIGESFGKELLHPAYALYAQVLGENLLYALGVFVLACALFARRELRLR